MESTLNEVETELIEYGLYSGEVIHKLSIGSENFMFKTDKNGDTKTINAAGFMETRMVEVKYMMALC